jgi:hypothetical protein
LKNISFCLDRSIFNSYLISSSVNDILVPGLCCSPVPTNVSKLFSAKIETLSSEKNSYCLFLPSYKLSLFVIMYTFLNGYRVSFPVSLS